MGLMLSRRGTIHPNRGSTARLFDGVDDYLTPGSAGEFKIDGGSALTLAGWVKPGTSDTTERPMFGVWNTGVANQQYFMSRNGSRKLICAIRNSSGLAGVSTSTADVADNVWTHVALRWSGTVRGYINGTEDGSNVRSTPLQSPPTSLLIGADGDVGSLGRFWDGALADWAVWNVELATSAITDLAAGTTRPSDYPTGLRGYWTIAGAASPETDSSTFANGATVVGTTVTTGPSEIA